MQLVPVIEIRRGKVVHLAPKSRTASQVANHDLLHLVERFAAQGVRRVHIVDVDAIESGEPENVDLVARLKKQYPEIQVQVIGGIKSLESAYVWNDAAVDFLVLSGRALRQKNLLDDLCVEFPNQILVEVDCRQGKVAIGSGQPTFELEQLACQLADDGVVGLVLTNVISNGSATCRLEGEKQKNSEVVFDSLPDSISLPVFANGLIGHLSDLECLLESSARAPSGVLIRNTSYNGDFSLEEANQLIERYQN